MRLRKEQVLEEKLILDEYNPETQELKAEDEELLIKEECDEAAAIITETEMNLFVLKIRAGE